MFELTDDLKTRFRSDGFVVVERVLDGCRRKAAAARFGPLFRGEFETGVNPDEVNWQEGDDPSLTRQICNGWRADRDIARVVLDADLGRVCAELGGWPGARLLQDNVLWKPPGARALGFHQDNAYLRWFDPGEIVTCWMALDATSAHGGAMELVRGSHTWGESDVVEQFHGPADYRKPMLRAAANRGLEPEIVPVVVPAGGASFHHGWTWHGSGPNNGKRPRRALVMHCCSSASRYRPAGLSRGTGPIYGRYKRLMDNVMDENFFPILWTRDGYRTPALQTYCKELS